MKGNYNIFNNCKNIEEAKKLFRTEAMKCHPDHGGDQEDFIKLKRQFDDWASNNENVNAGSDDIEKIILEMLMDYPEFASHVRKLLKSIPSEIMEIEGLSEIIEAAMDNPKANQLFKAVNGVLGFINELKK